MKKLVLLFSLIITLCTSSVMAQNIFHEHGYAKGNYNWIVQFNKSQDNYKTQKIKSITGTTKEYRKDSSIKRIWTNALYELDEQGRLIKYKYLNRKGKSRITYEITYSKNGSIQTIDKTHYNSHSQTTYFYLNDTLLSAVKSQTKSDALGIFYTYTQDYKLAAEKLVKNGKQQSRVEYAYYADGSKKYTRIYDKKDKLDYTYNYDCGIMNSLNPKRKDTSTICSKSTLLPNGNEQMVQEELDEKGRISRTINTFNTAKKWYLTESYSSKNKLKYRVESSVDELGRHHRKLKYYNKRGKLKFAHNSINWKDKFGFTNSIDSNEYNERSELIYSYTFYPEK